MSDKITSKNLSYDTKIPPFLRALHAQAAGGAVGPDPILSRRRRAGKKRSESEEAEDAPLVVDSEGNVVDVRVGANGAVDEGEAKRDEREEEEKKKKREVEKIAGIGAGRKRKAGKVIGDGAEEAKEAETKDDEGPKKKTGGKKKGKKMKLSFDEPE